MDDQLWQVVANVRDHGAFGDGRHDDTVAIRAAIATKRQVLFPEGSYLLAGGSIFHFEEGALTFDNNRQRVTFLSGARLLLHSGREWVRITGTDQEIVGMRIEGVVDSGNGAHSPMLEIDGADRLTLRAFDVACGPPTVIVGVQNTRGLTLDSGRIHGSNSRDTVGLRLGEGAHEVRGSAVAIDQLDVSVDIVGSSRSVAFEGGTFEGTITAAIRVRGEVEGLVISDQHFEGRARGARYGAHRFLHVEEGGVIRGGSISGCLFGATAIFPGGLVQRAVPFPELDPRGVGELAVVDLARPRWVFHVEGRLEGVVVSGCVHQYGEAVVWELTETATVSKSCDLFNFWDNVPAVTAGENRDRLPFIGDNANAVTLTAKSIQVNAERIGFCGEAPVGPARTYRVPAAGSRDLADPEWMVLSQLIQDLAALGLIRCETVA